MSIESDINDVKERITILKSEIKDLGKKEEDDSDPVSRWTMQLINKKEELALKEAHLQILSTLEAGQSPSVSLQYEQLDCRRP